MEKDIFVLEYNEKSEVNHNFFMVTNLGNTTGQTIIVSEAAQFDSVAKALDFADEHNLALYVHPQRIK